MPKSVTRRTLLSFWWLFSLVLSVVYISLLTASLTADKPVYPFYTLKQMVEQREYKWGYLGQSSWETLTKNSTDETTQRMYQGVLEFEKVDSLVRSPNLSDHMRMLEEDKYAFIGTIPSDELEDLGRDGSAVIELPAVSRSFDICAGFPLNSPLKTSVEQSLGQLRQYGIMPALARKYWPYRRNKAVEANKTQISLSMVKSAFFTVLFGIGGSLVILILEIVIWKLKRLRSAIKTQ